MVNKIIDGISTTIYEVFGSNFEIYTEPVEQGFKEPCFSIMCVNSLSELYLCTKYFSENRFCITYFPVKTEKNSECNSVSQKLCDCLEFILVSGDLTKGTKIKCEMTNGILNFFVNYDMFIRKIKPIITMDSCDVNTKMED